MPDVEAWQAFGGVGAVLIFLGALVFALKRLGIIRAPEPAPAPDASKRNVDGQAAKLERELADLRLHIAENYVRRDDYIRNQSQMIGLLENHGVMLARLEERIGARL